MFSNEKTYTLKVSLLSLSKNLDPRHQSPTLLSSLNSIHTNGIKRLLPRHRHIRPITRPCRSPSLRSAFLCAGTPRRGQLVDVESWVLHDLAEEDVGGAIGAA